MSELEDFEFRDAPAEPAEPAPPPPPRHEPGGARWLLAPVAVLALAVAAYFVFRSSPAPAPVASPEPRVVATPAPAAEPSAAVALPALSESDGFVRELARALSGDPRLAAWLAAEELVRRFVGAVVAVADGQSPRGPLDVLAPKGGFAVVERRGRTLIDPASYARYDGVVDAFVSLEVAGCARLVRQLQPLLDAAYRELGFSDAGFSVPLRRAFRTLLETPVPEGDVAVRRAARPALLYEYADPRLEALAPAQKHLLRLGPRNAARLKGKLRELQDALGAS